MTDLICSLRDFVRSLKKPLFSQTFLSMIGDSEASKGKCLCPIFSSFSHASCYLIKIQHAFFNYRSRYEIFNIHGVLNLEFYQQDVGSSTVLSP